MAVWRELVEGKETADNDFLRRGREAEPRVLRHYANAWNVELTYPGTVRHPSYPRVAATPDAVANGSIVVEVKTVNARSFGRWGDPLTDAIPPEYLAQVHYQLGVMGMAEAHVPALKIQDDGKSRLDVYLVNFNEEFFSFLASAAEEFWTLYVETKKPPPRQKKVLKGVR